MLVMAIVLIGILWFLVLGFANSSLQSLRLASRALASERATNAAESGLLVTLQELSQDPDYRPPKSFQRMQNSSEKYMVRILEGRYSPVRLPEGTVYVLSTGQERNGGQRQVGAVVKLGKAKESLLNFSVFTSSLDLNGGSSIDSFDSRTGQSSRESATLGTNSESPGSIRMGSGTWVRGEIKVGPKGKPGQARPNRPNFRSDDTVWKNWSAWSLEESTLEERVDYPAVDSPASGKKDFKINWKGAEIAPGSYGDLRASGGGQVQLRGGTYVFDSIKLTGGARISLSDDKPTVIYVKKKLDMSNGTVYNTSRKPRNLLFMMDRKSKAKLTGGAKAYMVVYGPEASITMSGGTNLYGALVAKEIKMTGGARLHYDVDLKNNPPAVLSGGSSSQGGVSVVSWQRL